MRPTCLICDKEFESTRCVGNSDMQKFWICDSCFADAALGRAVRKEIALLENSREQGNILSDTEDDWLNDLQGFVAGLMEVEK
jgi:hypothetical protein